VSKAFQRHLSPDYAGTIPLYKQAIDVDPSFALAYASVGTVYLRTANLPEAIANEKRHTSSATG
jgi:hypothetical protein